MQQGVIYETLRGGEFLTDAEQEVLRWGKNANVKVPKRFHQSGIHGQIYKEATAIECLVCTTALIWNTKGCVLLLPCLLYGAITNAT